MRVLGKRLSFASCLAACFIVSLYLLDKWFAIIARPGSKGSEPPPDTGSPSQPNSTLTEPQFHWDKVPQRYPVASIIPLPSGKPLDIPRIQHHFGSEDTSSEESRIREKRLHAVQQTFEHAWEGYRQHAWLKDEVSPISGGNRNTFGGWAATLVDSLDTLWIMSMRKEFDEAVSALIEIDFTKSSEEEINVFETTIRYLGGFLSAYDLSGYSALLHKALELGEMLYVAFDTPNRMPITRWKWES